METIEKRADAIQNTANIENPMVAIKPPIAYWATPNPVAELINTETK